MLLAWIIMYKLNDFFLFFRASQAEPWYSVAERRKKLIQTDVPTYLILLDQ